MRLSLLIVLAFLYALPAVGLEKSAKRMDDDREEAWTSGSSCQIRYFNICNGWIWCWSGFAANERLGLIVDSCCESSTLLETALYLCSSAGPSYTGSISAHAVDDEDCLVEPPLATRLFFPSVAGYVVNDWQGISVPSRFALVVKAPSNGYVSSPEFGTDRPSSPGAPCGTCYPVDRPTRSFLFGTPSAPLCPGSPFEDGTCNAELMWHVLLSCSIPVSNPVEYENSTWGAIKSLYR